MSPRPRAPLNSDWHLLFLFVQLLQVLRSLSAQTGDPHCRGNKNRGGHRGYYKSDLVYVDIAHIVLEWNGNSPKTMVALDPAHLTGPNASGEYFYDLEIEDPRPLS